MFETEAVRENYELGVTVGEARKQKKILELLNSYFELTKFSEQYEGAKPNQDWDNGFQAAIALIKGENK